MSPTPIGQKRNAGVVILLIIITLGIYNFIWYYKINSEIKKHDPSQDFSPGLALLALFIPIANLVSYYNTANRIKLMQKVDSPDDLISPALALLLAFLFYIGYPIYLQAALNNHWHEHRDDILNHEPLLESPAPIPPQPQVEVLPDPGALSREPALAYELHALSGPLSGAGVDLSGDPVVIGRDPKVSNLIIPLGNISRKHCTLKIVNGNVVLEDHGSANGTFLADGQRLTSGLPYKLQAGDQFFLADPGIRFEIRAGK